jgi:ABC-type multidrug transport system fused ATPase/permease subunit
MGGAARMRAADSPMRGTGRALTAELTKKKKPELKKVLPEVWKLVLPRKWLIAGSFLLMIVNRLCSLVLPISSRPFINDVMKQGKMKELPAIIGAVASAVFVQAITSYALTQLLSTEGQKLISDLRKQVQAHIGRLPVSFYDENRTGTLVARIMTDVEGVRNLVGTGLLDFVGGVLTAGIVFVVLLSINARMTGLTLGILLVFGVILQRAFKTIRPIFRERPRSMPR